MNTLTFEKFKIKGVNFGETSCLPDIKNDDYIRAPLTILPEVTDEERKYMGKGMIPTLLPHQVQNQYDRARIDLELDAAVLENEYLKATFVTSLGGRLWSLYDKKAGKELLYANDVFQPGNLALRNAWFSGGVEWNIGIKGHNMWTCSPLFAEELKDKDGNPMLRMYEYERIRGVAYSITAKLEKDVLLVRPEIENTSDNEVYMYWWSNIAVDETPDTRVIAPCEQSFRCAYEEGAYFLGNADIPVNDGVDVTYTTNLERSRDFFYKIPENEKKWITAVNEAGYGLIHMSTPELTGRKVFAWGEGAGGKHWNEWLSDCGKKYIEIQAGLLKTQLEHFPMAAKSTLSWTEGYGAFQGNPEILHGRDWNCVIDEVKNNINKQQMIVENAEFEIAGKGELKYMGSGWGAIENMIREAPISNHLDFPEASVNGECAEWVKLLKTGELDIPNKNAPIKSYVKGEFWIEKLKATKDSWYKFNQLGVTIFATNGNIDGAYKAFLKSVELEPNAWSYRNLAQIEKNEYRNLVKASEYMEKAIAEKNDYQPLWVNYAEALAATKNFKKWTEVYEQDIPQNLKADGRLKMFYALALTETDRYEEALAILMDNFVMPDIKEGEFSISHIWLQIHRKMLAADEITEITDDEIYEKYPLPYELDFRMH
ncbi:MAG: DUF5107 domain-containing protein [Clostridia bacterium]|nr:DUF5107 domain-containing protein [Clostridia bacterium]